MPENKNIASKKNSNKSNVKSYKCIFNENKICTDCEECFPYYVGEKNDNSSK